MSQLIKQEPESQGILGLYSSLSRRFDPTFVAFFSIQTFNQGLWIMVRLAALVYYKEKCDLDPGDVQLYIAIINLPWTFKFIYGLLSDNIPFFGYRRKSYLILFSFILFLSIMAIFVLQPENPAMVTFYLTCANFCLAFISVVTEATMVTQCRSDPEFGSQDFMSLNFFCRGIGGVIGSIFGGAITENYDPIMVFFWYSLIGLVMVFYGLLLNKTIEDANQLNKPISVAISENTKTIISAFQLREIYQIALFFLIDGFLNPSFENFTYYFLMDQIHISKITYSFLILVSRFCSILGAMFYKAYGRHRETRTMVTFAMCISATGSLMQYFFAKRWNLEVGVSDFFFLLFTDVVFNVLGVLFFGLPVFAFIAKVTPPGVEGTIYASLSGMADLSFSVIAPLMGSLINQNAIGVSKDNMEGYPTLIFITLIGSLLTFIAIPMIPTKKQMEEWKAQRHTEMQEFS